MATYKEKFAYYQPIFRTFFSKADTDKITEEMECNLTTTYSYLAGKLPSKGNTLLFISEGIKILDKKKIQYTKI